MPEPDVIHAGRPPYYDWVRVARTFGILMASFVALVIWLFTGDIRVAIPGLMLVLAGASIFAFICISACMSKDLEEDFDQ